MASRVGAWARRAGPAPGNARRSGAQSGQATVELALSLPVVCLLFLALVQVGLVVHDQVLVTHAAREAARAAAVSGDPAAPRRAAAAGGGLDPALLAVRVDGRGAPGSSVHVHVDYTSVTNVPGVGPLLPDLHLVADATMRVES